VIEGVLDASALLALLNGEPGADIAVRIIPGAHIGAVNLEEAVAKLAIRGMPEPDIRTAIESLGLIVHPFTADLAFLSGLLRPQTDRFGLSLGDRACLALALQLDLPAYTSDTAWPAAGAPLGIPIQQSAG
jgi:ribonuclease VapC